MAEEPQEHDYYEDADEIDLEQEEEGQEVKNLLMIEETYTTEENQPDPHTDADESEPPFRAAHDDGEARARPEDNLKAEAPSKSLTRYPPSADSREQDSETPSLQPLPEQKAPDSSSTSSGASSLQHRLRQLKQKINQAKHLNQQAVQEEGQRMTYQGQIRERQQRAAGEKKAQQERWQTEQAKALQVAGQAGVEGRSLTQAAAEAVYQAQRRSEKVEMQRFHINDYHNPEGQFRHYVRDLKSLPRHHQQGTSTSAAAGEGGDEDNTMIYNPLMPQVQGASVMDREREGARRIAKEMHRRIEKRRQQDAKRKRQDAEGQNEGDVSYINQRNKRFNEKINRNYDKHTAEIRQNLERGTAL